jgi:uncharacterized protein YndB with AHSA1/START domain
MEPFGELIGPNAVRFERLLPGPIERVWSFLVDPDRRAKWLCGGDTEPHVGGLVEMHFHNASLSDQGDKGRPDKYRDMPERVQFSGTVTRFEPPHVLSHTWVFEANSSEVSYELSEVGDKVRLILTHTRLNSNEEVHSVCAGWHTHLGILMDVLEDRSPRPFWDTHTALEIDYARRLST